jgi:hypothetical protein
MNHALKTYVVELRHISSPNFSNRLRWKVFFTFRPLDPRQRERGTHLVRYRVVPRAGLDDPEMKKTTCFRQQQNDPYAVQHVAMSLYQLSYPDSTEQVNKQAVKAPIVSVANLSLGGLVRFQVY